MVDKKKVHAICESLVLERVENGCTLDVAINTPLGHVKMDGLQACGVSGDLVTICKTLKVDFACVYSALLHLHTLEWAIKNARRE